MKKVLFSFVLFSTSSFFGQQTPVSQSPTNKNVVIEEFTGIHCGFCPDGHRVAADIKEANPGRVVVSGIHAGGYATPSGTEPDFRTADGTALDDFAAVSGYPAGMIQRKDNGGELAMSRSAWEAKTSEQLSQVSPMNVAMDATIDAATRQLTLHVEIFYTSPFPAGTTHYLNIGMLQNNIEGYQSNYGSYNPDMILSNGNYLHQHVFRGFINVGGTWGEAIDASSTGVITKTITMTLPATIGNVDLNIGNLDFFALVHEGHNTATNSKIFTAAEITPSFTNIPSGTASLNSIINALGVCEGNGSIQPIVKVINSGDAINSLTFSSSINGGTPVVYNWTGSISAFGSQEITLSDVSFTPLASNNNLVVNITSVNGGTGNLGSVVSQTKPITVYTSTATSTNMTVKVTTDQYGSETTWEIKNSAEIVVASGGPYSNGSASGAFPQPDENFVLSDNDCYSIYVYDSYGDGFNGSFGDGDLQVFSNGVAVVGFPDFSSSAFDKKFKVSAVSGLTQNSSDQTNFTTYPNPAKDKLFVSFDGSNQNAIIQLIDLQGRTIWSMSDMFNNEKQDVEIPISTIDAGSYIVSVEMNGIISLERIVVNK